MKKEQKQKVFMVVAFIGLLSVSVNASLTEWFEDFQSGSDGWVMAGQWLDDSIGEPNSFTLFNGTANGHHAIRSIGTTAGAFEVTFWVYIRGNEGVDADAETVSYGVTSGEVTAEAWDNFQIDLQAYIGDGDNKAYMRVWNGDVPADAIEVSKNTWHSQRLVVKPDVTNGGTFDWYLNDVLQAENYSFRFDPNAESTGFAIWHWASDNTLESFIDDINVQMIDPIRCEDVRLAELLILGDISGPDGVPDCRVNIMDFAALASSWLNCNDPEDPTCSPTW